MKTTWILSLTLLLSGCAHTQSTTYRALDMKRTNPDHLKKAESLRVTSVSFKDVTLARAIAAFYISEEYPPAFQNTIIFMNDDADWSQQKINFTIKDTSFARLCNELCIQTGSVWWADTVIHIKKKK